MSPNPRGPVLQHPLVQPRRGRSSLGDRWHRLLLRASVSRNQEAVMRQAVQKAPRKKNDEGEGRRKSRLVNWRSKKNETRKSLSNNKPKNDLNYFRKKTTLWRRKRINKFPSLRFKHRQYCNLRQSTHNSSKSKFRHQKTQDSTRSTSKCDSLQKSGNH